MADNSELFELILKIAGQEKVAKLTSDLAQAERGLGDVAASAGLMGKSFPIAEATAFANKIAALKAELAKTQAALNATAMAEVKAATATEKAAAKTEAATNRKVAALERAAKAADKAAAREAIAAGRASSITGRTAAVKRAEDDAKKADQEATRRAVAADKAASMAARGSSSDREINRALKRAGLPTLDDDGPSGRRGRKGSVGRLTGADRAGAFSRLGLFAANTSQDMIQGGPASGINNVLGIAGDKGIKALIGEGVAALGGLTAIATGGAIALATLAAGFVLIDQGLKSAKLDWSDFGTVVANLSAFHAAGETFEGLSVIVSGLWKSFGETAIGSGAIAFVTSIGDSLGKAVGFIDEWTLGWTRATVAAKQHKDEVDRAVQSARAYGDAVEHFGKVKSEDQKQKEKTGDLVDQELANLGGAGGVEGLAAKLAEKSIQKGADDKIKVQEEIQKDGKGTGKFQEVEVTRREAQRRAILDRLKRARDLDPNAIGDVAQRLKSAGIDPSGFLDATKGVDKKEVDKEKAKAAKQKVDDAAKEEMDNLDREAKEGSDKWNDDLKAARKSKSWMHKLTMNDLSPAEKAAKEEYDKFEGGVDAAMKGRTWLGLEDTELTPEQREGRKRQNQREQAKDDRLRGITEANPELKGLLAGSLANTAQLGGSIGQAQNALFGDLASRFGEDAARSLLTEAGGDARKGLIGDMFQQGQQNDPVRVIEGTSSLRDSIQSAVKADDGWTKAVREFQISNGLLEKILNKPGGLG